MPAQKQATKGYDCAVSAIEMVNLIRELEKKRALSDIDSANRLLLLLNR